MKSVEVKMENKKGWLDKHQKHREKSAQKWKS